MCSLAKRHGQWLHEPRLAQMGRDLEAQRGSVAVRDEEAPAFITWTPLDDEAAEFTWMGVAEHHQHQGIGTALVAAVRLGLRHLGVARLVVSAVADSTECEPYEQIRTFYRAPGSVDDRVTPRRWGDGDDRHGRLVMRLDVRSA